MKPLRRVYKFETNRQLLRRQNGVTTKITRDDCKKEVESILKETIAEEQLERTVNDELNLVDRGFLLSIRDIDFCPLDLEFGDNFAPPSVGMILEARRKGVIK
ncbi:hypothetical protein P7H60_13695 [Vagococcus carniphilus]|uniref:hypothetical protein n=1 Tax=Vagococcus carniphilus TaxID=218144 RepID=UPI00288EB991|nr:hypothetical protein [Vagococcus carniphilus]MDT2850203.1 hypothetical protein [Vagococcus carniphilus]